MTRKELPAQAANIKRAVGSTATCTQATVDSLKSILLPERSSVLLQQTPATNARGIRLPPSIARTTKAQCNKSKKQPEVAILEVNDTKLDTILPQERFALATEVINSTLKGLTDFIKKSHGKVPQKNQPSLAKSPSYNSLSNGLETGSHLPLQPLCINRLSSTPPERSRPSRRASSGIFSKETLGIVAQAECARVAFATLRSMNAQKGMGFEMPYLRLENGMSALIGKLIALGLDDLAVKELRILKRRLEVLAKPGPKDDANPIRSQSSWSAEEQSAKKETLSGLLKFQNVDASGPVLALIISLQLQVLKLIASKGDPKVTEAVIEHLQLSVPYSPANLIQIQTDKKLPSSQDKPTNQLASLSQLLLSLCPSVSNTEDEKASELQSMSPSTALQFQLLALEFRSIWWQLAVHRGDVTKEMLEPFIRFLVCFRRRSTLGRAAKYSTIKVAFQSLCSHVDITKNAGNPLFNQSLIALYQILADLAQDSAKYDEALEWTGKSTKLTAKNGDSQSRMCALACRTAALQIHACTNHSYEDYTLFSLKEAAKDLEGDLPGGSADLDELLVTVASLRRAVFSVLHDTYKSSQPEKKWPRKFVSQCSEILVLGIRFLVRYVGKDPGPGAYEKLALRHLQRLKLAMEVSDPFIESIVALARYSVASVAEDWERIDGALQDCLRLALNLEVLKTNHIQEIHQVDRKPSVFVSLSNAYWHRYLHLRQKVMDSKNLRRDLETSIAIIKNRSVPERVAAMLPMKLEKFGMVNELSRDFKRAGDAYAEALHLQVEAGSLRIAAEAAATRPVSLVFETNGDQILLGRLLLAYARTTVKIDDEVPYSSLIFDNPTLPASERGVLLEQQLSAIVSALRAQQTSARLHIAVQGLISLLLAVYTKMQFPIRRFRVANQCFQLLSTYPTMFDGILFDQLSREHLLPMKSPSLALDVSLEQFIPHLIASRDISLILCEDTPNVKTIETRLAEWSKLAQDFSDWSLLQTRVTDILNWLSQLELLAEYLEMQGADLLRLSVLHILASVQEAAISTSCHALILKLSALGLQYVRLGYPGKAGRVLKKAQKYVETGGIPSEIRIQWHLAYAECALEMGNIVRSQEHLNEAQEQLVAGAQGKSMQKPTTNELTRHTQLSADLTHIQSSIAAAKGQLSKALLLSRSSVKLSRRAWAMMERSRSKAAKSGLMKLNAKIGLIDPLSDSISEMSISRSQEIQTVPSTYAALQGVFFWPLVPRLFRGLHHLSKLYAHEGLFSEARYYSQEGQKVAEAVKAKPLKIRSLTQLGNYFVRSGSFENGVKLLEQAQNTTSLLQRDRYFAELQLYLVSMHVSQKEWGSGESAAVLCEQTVDTLMSPDFVDSLIHRAAESQSLDGQMNEMTLQDNAPAPQIKRRLPAKKPGRKPVAPAKPAYPASTGVPTSEVSILSRMKGDILRQRALIAMCGHNRDVASALLIEAAVHIELAQDRVSHQVLAARLCLQQGLERMVSDPVFGVLPESTVSHPSTRSPGDRFERDPQKTIDITPPRNLPLKAPLRKTKRSRSPMPTNFVESLHQAQDGINKVCPLAITAGTTASMHSLTDTMAKTLMMLSAIAPSKQCNSTSSTFIVYATELGRIVAMMRESQALQVERTLADTQDGVDWTRSKDSDFAESLSISNSLGFSIFQKEYIDIIPKSWNVISISLSELRDEIRISKIRSGKTPFILNLPLNRHNSRDADEDIFGFDQAKTELQDIIMLANYSTHDAQDMSRKGAKSAWWEARAALDARLKDLLVNVESIWLGGFRGVFSQEIHDSDLLSRFQQSLHNILDRHLPSRQKSGKGRKDHRAVLDPRVLELLVEMGDPDEAAGLDEPLMDLLYFVIDILQFNGERNAYDEIDFDSIAIETMDALRQYHQASKAISHDDKSQHTILILDKALHCFPWESLPCMNGHAISRLPSLGCLRDRILRQQQQGGARPANEGWQVDRKSGACVLNPGGDLTATQAKFEKPLENLVGWESIVGREPTEDEMQGYLESCDVFLYFGHGSGGQYIRSRTIKKLDSCSVALLMGCSSGALTEAGEFESYGTPINYMHAGCPALLATLWDVTDKDIDRFSFAVLEKWGLLREAQTELSGSPVKRGVKQRGKNKAAMVKTIESESLSLDQAVSQGRDSCILKYLNGAAPVVYGVPVFLS